MAPFTAGLGLNLKSHQPFGVADQFLLLPFFPLPLSVKDLFPRNSAVVADLMIFLLPTGLLLI